MSATITKPIVVRAKRPGGFWSAGMFFPDTPSTVEVTAAQFEQLVADRAKGFLELRGEDHDDILEPGGVPRSEHEQLVEELERVRGDVAAARAEAEECRAARDAALAEVETLKAKLADTEKELAAARAPSDGGGTVPADVPVDEPPKPKKGR